MIQRVIVINTSPQLQQLNKINDTKCNSHDINIDDRERISKGQKLQTKNDYPTSGQ